MSIPVSPTARSSWTQRTSRYATYFKKEICKVMESLQNKRSAEATGSQNMMEFFRGRHLDVQELYASTPSLTQPLSAAELDPYRSHPCALRLRGFHKSPNDPAAWYAYMTKIRLEKWAAPAVWTLLLLDVFETPQWCKNRPFVDLGGCKAADSKEYILSGVPLIPISLGVGLESLILFFLFIHLVSHVRLYSILQGGHATTAGVLLLEFSLLILIAVSKVGMFFLYTVVIFAWVATTVLDDEEGKDQFGQPVREGFATFGESLYTCFTTLNTATLPDSMVPSYDYSRSYLLLWTAFRTFGGG
eukprot:g10955.t1